MKFITRSELGWGRRVTFKSNDHCGRTESSVIWMKRVVNLLLGKLKWVDEIETRWAGVKIYTKAISSEFDASASLCQVEYCIWSSHTSFALVSVYLVYCSLLHLLLLLSLLVDAVYLMLRVTSWPVRKKKEREREIEVEGFYAIELGHRKVMHLVNYVY